MLMPNALNLMHKSVLHLICTIPTWLFEWVMQVLNFRLNTAKSHNRFRGGWCSYSNFFSHCVGGCHHWMVTQQRLQQQQQHHHAICDFDRLLTLFVTLLILSWGFFSQVGFFSLWFWIGLSFGFDFCYSVYLFISLHSIRLLSMYVCYAIICTQPNSVRFSFHSIWFRCISKVWLAKWEQT